MKKLFVYGSLKREEIAKIFLKNAKFICECWIHGILYDLNTGFPAVSETSLKFGNKVFGKLYEISDDDLQAIDEYEGYKEDDIEDSLYIRTTVDVYSCKSENLGKAEVYVMPEKNLAKFFYEEIPDGRW